MNKTNHRKWRTKLRRILFAVAVCTFLSGCGSSGQNLQLPGVEPIPRDEYERYLNSKQKNSKDMEESSVQDTLQNTEEELEKQLSSIIQSEGDVLETRILPPDGYERTDVEEGSLAEFLHNYPMKPDGSRVHLYDGSDKGNQTVHAAVFDLPLENYDLQQCADSVIRIYAEYYWAREEYDKIRFHFTNGFMAEYTKWRDGSRITVNGNHATWVPSKERDTSYECFVRYLRTIFCYAGTLSMEQESHPTTIDRLKAGDVFLHGGTPGHVVMVVDVCKDAAGKKAFLLAQGYMPAQEFHLLKNERHPEDPWYYEEEIVFPLSTPEYTFEEGSIRSLDY